MNNSANTGDSSPSTLSRPDSLERLLSHRAARNPQKTALCDPPNRSELEKNPDHTGPRQYNFGELDKTVTRLAARFTSLGLQTGDYVAVQLPNFTETPIIVLGLMRAGLVPCLLPLSWSISEISLSFQRLNPRALIGCGQIEDLNPSIMMRELAFSNLHVRFVMGVGYNIADGVSDISPLFDPQTLDNPSDLPDFPGTQGLKDRALVTYIDPSTPVPHTSGQILATGLQHVLEVGLSLDDKILSPYPLSSIPGLAASFYPWLMTGCSLSLHHPFQFGPLQEQLQSTSYSFFSAPEQVVRWLLQSHLPIPQKLAIVRRDSHHPIKELQQLPSLDLFDLWNFGGLGSVITKYAGEEMTGLFREGRLCLPSGEHAKLCLAAGKVHNQRLYIKGRIFPGINDVTTSLEWISLQNRFDEEWLDTGLAAIAGPEKSILLGEADPVDLQKAAS
ncbi:MAG: acyl--CoA ligase [Hyphomicrobiaceae bacterium]|nr:acyl--CoA ligase [Hyphomicrobiaceae bacterium]